MTVEEQGSSGSLPSGSHPLVDLDRIVHGPARLMVMTSLYVVESADFVFLVNLTGLTWGNLSSHLSKLEEAGYITIDKQIVGKRVNTMVSLTEEGRRAFKEYKQQMKEVLDDLPE